MATSEPASYIIEPFDPEKHDRTAFSCGVEQVDNYFQKTANKLAKADNVRLYVMVDRDGTVIGFYALNAHAVQFTDLPAKFDRTRPSQSNIPAAYISMIGRDLKFRGGGFGCDLVVDALRRIAVAADAIGVAVVILDEMCIRDRVPMADYFTHFSCLIDVGTPDKADRALGLFRSLRAAAQDAGPEVSGFPLSLIHI